MEGVYADHQVKPAGFIFVRIYMIGLERNTVRLEEHQDDWPVLFEQEALRIRQHIAHLFSDIQHVGSTAIPGLLAKPIIDIAVRTNPDTEIAMLVQKLVEIGYIDGGDAGSAGGYLLVKESDPEIRTFHLHIVAYADTQWQDYLYFRDELSRDPEMRSHYAILKRKLADLFADNRRAYTDGKSTFIRTVLKKGQS